MCSICTSENDVIIILTVLDSEWHAFCECPGFAAARSRSCFSTALQINCSNPCTVGDLCSFVAAVVDGASLSGELARFALNIRSS